MKVVISGYFGFDNAGDEAILEAMLAELRALRPDVRPVVLSGDPSATEARFDVEAVPRLSVPAVLRALRGASLFISGGGSLLQDATGWGSVPYYAGLMRLAGHMGVPVFVYAQGIGPLRRRPLRALAQRALVAAAEITVRDRQSYETLRKMGVPEDKMTVTADPVFGLALGDGGRPGTERSKRAAYAAPGRHASCLSSIVPDGPLIGIALRPLPSRSELADDAVAEAVAAALGPRLARWGAAAVLVPLHRSRDDAVLEKLRKRLAEMGGGGDVVTWSPHNLPGSGHGSAREWIDVFSRFEICLTMRLHGLIFAACAGTPFVALSDDPKVGAHVDELGLSRKQCLVSPPSATAARTAGALSVAEELGRRLDAVWARRSDVRRQLNDAAAVLADRARDTARRALRWAEVP